MTQRPETSIPELLSDHAAIEAVRSRAAREAALKTAAAGKPVAVWRDGAVVWLQPEEVLARLSAKPVA